MTAYRQQALLCAGAWVGGAATTRALALIVPGAPTIVLRNVYGWFERVERGKYRLTPEGHVAVGRVSNG
jgi:hypothetical protein